MSMQRSFYHRSFAMLALVVFGMGLMVPQRSHAHTAHTTSAQAAQGDCTGYAEPRRWVESQHWWQDPGVSTMNAGHLHLSACVPANQTIRGELVFDVTVKLHNSPAKVWLVGADVMQVARNVQEGCGNRLTCTPVSLSCQTADCTFTVKHRFDSRRVLRDGWHTIALLANAQFPNGRQLNTAIRFTAQFRNGFSSYNTTTAGHVHGSGWHQFVGYQFNDLSTWPTVSNGMLRFTLNQTAPDFPERQSDAITEHEVLIDPDLHHGRRGTVVRTGRGPLMGTISVPTTGLAPGSHKLLIRAGTTDPDGKGTGNGVVVFSFMVP